MASGRHIMALFAIALLVMVPGGQSVGTYGTPATETSTGVVGKLTAFTSSKLVYLDNQPTDSQLGNSEAIFMQLTLGTTTNYVVVSNPSGSGFSGSVGAITTTAPTGTLVDVPGTPWKFVDTLPDYASGGPDGKFNPGEPLFLDLDANNGISSADRIIATGTGLSGSIGGSPTSSTETTWAKASECIYISTDGTEGVGDTRIDDGAATCSGAALTAISNVKITSVTNERTVSSTTAAGSTTVTSSAGFLNTDVGKLLVGTGIPAGTTVTGVTDTSTITISAAATAAGTNNLNIQDQNSFDAAAEAAYITTGSTVDTGAYRIHANTPLTSATVVQCGNFGSDSDCGDALYAPSNVKVSSGVSTLATPTPKLMDANGNALFDANDRIVLDVDASGFISPADVRFSTSAGQTFGARPTLGDQDVASHTTINLAGTPKLIWLDSDNNGQIETTEPMALSIDGTAGFAIGDVCLTTVGGCTAGSQRTGATTAASGTWKLASTASNPANFGYLDANNNNKFDRGDELYIHLGTVPANVGTGDLVIASDSGTSGSRVTTGGSALKAITPSFRAFDADGGGDYSTGDLVYAAAAAFTDAVPGMARLNSGTNVNGFGKILSDSDADAVLKLTTAGGTQWAYRDLDGSTTLSSADAFYLLPRGGTCPLQGPDVLISPGQATGTAGSFAGGDTSACTLVTTPKIGYSPQGIYSKDSKVFVDMDADGSLEVGDVRLTTSSGSRISGSSNADLNTPVDLITFGAALGPRASNVALTAIDSSGDGIIAASETVILDVDGDGYYTPGDVPLSGTGVAGTPSSGGGGGSAGGGSTSNAAYESVASANTAVMDSLTVTREGDDAVVKWTGSSGVTGYQVWRSTSPWELLATLQSTASEYRDAGAPDGAKYVVTSYVDNNGVRTGFYTSLEGASVPGNSALQGASLEDASGGGTDTMSSTSSTTTSSSSSASGGDDEAVPAPFIMLPVVLAALALARRRL